MVHSLNPFILSESLQTSDAMKEGKIDFIHVLNDM